MVCKTVRFAFLVSGLTKVSIIEETLSQLLATSVSPNITPTHRVAAWNALCTYIDHCHSSKVADLQSLLWSNGFWERCMNLYLEHSQKARPKSSKQLLTTLTNAAKQSTHFDADIGGIKSRLSEMLMGKISDYCKPEGGKPYLQALAQVVGKDALTLDGLASSIAAPGVGDPDKRGNMDFTASLLAGTILRWLGVSDYASATIQLLVSILDKADQSSFNSSASIWPRALSSALQSSVVDAEALKSHVFPVLFARSKTGFVTFMDELRSHQSDELIHTANMNAASASFDAYVAALQSAKDIGLLIESRGAFVLRENDERMLSMATIRSWTHAQDPAMRLAALSLLINDRAITTPFSTPAFAILKKCLPSFHADTDPWFRGEVFALFQRLVDRMRAATAVLARDQGREPSHEALHQHDEFLAWCLRFVQWELRPTASYQRHTCALRCLSILSRSGLDSRVPKPSQSRLAQGETRWPMDRPVMSNGLERLLVDLLLDPFDDVRQAAATILGLYMQGSSPVCNANYTTVALNRAENVMLASGRADQADGVAHMYALLSQLDAADSPFEDSTDERLVPMLLRLETMLRTAEGSLAAAVGKYPLHGMLTSVKYVLVLGGGEKISDRLFALLVSCLHGVWSVVKPTLCNDAPEGYQTEDAEESSDMSSKDTLSYCWRALKEASLLLGALLPSAQRRRSQDGTTPTIITLSDLCFEQLAELRHRGAFSTVAQTWIACCAATRATSGEAALKAYYDRTMSLLRNNVTINTRRSAGLPSLICGILIADNSGVLVARALSDLEIAAREPVDAKLAHEGSLPQVHALNCVKEILKNTRLGERSELHVPTAMQLAADSLRSEAWAVRNCGLMLFRGVLDRLLGSNDSYIDDDAPAKAKQLNLEKHPQLYDTVIGLLEAPSRELETSVRSSEGVFPALQLLQRARVPTSKLGEVRKAVLYLTASPLWHVRDKAARTYASFIRSDEVLDEVYRLLSYNQPFADQNALHGRLLSVKYALAVANRGLNISILLDTTPSGSSDALKDQFELILGNNELYTTNRCRLTQAAYIDTLQEALSRYRRCHLLAGPKPNGPDAALGSPQDSVMIFCRDILEPNKSVLVHPGAAALRNSLAKLYAENLACTGINLEDLDTIFVGCDVLGQADSDALCTLLEAFNDIRTAESQQTEAAQHEAARQLNLRVLSTAKDIRVKAAAQRGLLVVLDSPLQQEDTSSKPGIAGHDMITDALDAGSNQLFADQHLELQASQFQCLANARDNGFEQQMQLLVQWVAVCGTAVSGEGLHSREAAARAMARLQCWHQLRDREDLNETLLQLCLTIYDLLNDDDEDLRLEAADTTCRLLGLGQRNGLESHLLPLVACQKLVAFMVERWNSHRGFAEIAFSRAFGKGGDDLISAPQQLAETSRDSTALFAEEKQNLYIDEAREVRLWSQVAMSLGTHAVPKRLVKELSHWVSEGLGALRKKAKEESDGPLGWSTKPEVFVLGLQVVYAVETLLSLSARGARLGVKPSSIRLGLVGFLGAGQSCQGSGANPLWEAEIRRALRNAVREQVSRTARLVRLVYPVCYSISTSPEDHVVTA